MTMSSEKPRGFPSTAGRISAGRPRPRRRRLQYGCATTTPTSNQTTKKSKRPFHLQAPRQPALRASIQSQKRASRRPIVASPALHEAVRRKGRVAFGRDVLHRSAARVFDPRRRFDVAELAFLDARRLRRERSPASRPGRCRRRASRASPRAPPNRRRTRRGRAASESAARRRAPPSSRPVRNTGRPRCAPPRFELCATAKVKTSANSVAMPSAPKLGLHYGHLRVGARRALGSQSNSGRTRTASAARRTRR